MSYTSLGATQTCLFNDDCPSSSDICLGPGPRTDADRGADEVGQCVNPADPGPLLGRPVRGSTPTAGAGAGTFLVIAALGIAGAVAWSQWKGA